MAEYMDGARWYVAHTYSGYENKVKTNLEKIVENRSLQDKIFDIQIPVITETVQDGETTKEVESKVFPSYVLVKMIMTDETWHVVRNITGVTGFVGPGSEPTPLTDAEIEMFNVEVHSDELMNLLEKMSLWDKIKIVDAVNISLSFWGFAGLLVVILATKTYLPAMRKLIYAGGLTISVLGIGALFAIINPSDIYTLQECVTTPLLICIRLWVMLLADIVAEYIIQRSRRRKSEKT